MITQLCVDAGITLDARRAVWLEGAHTLAVADLHLGYAWAQRAEGNLMPIGAPDDTLERLEQLVVDYKPAIIAVLGDIVQRATSLDPIRQELARLCAIGKDAQLRLVGGNHDRGLADLLRSCRLDAEVVPSLRLGEHLLVHGDAPAPRQETAPGGWTLLGHEHPAISIGDRISRVKCPCFLLGIRTLVLPAFTGWAAGSDARSRRFLSPISQEGGIDRAVAILAGKLLPVALR